MLSKLTKNARAIFNDPQDEIVVSGVAGRFPNSDNVAEFASNLYNKVDMVDDDERRWSHTNPEIPKRMGKVRNIDRFDHSFFGYHQKQSHAMDPQGRLLLEHAYEAVLDAGINPKSLKGSRTGVYVGCCTSDSIDVELSENLIDGTGLSGNARALLANRVSFFLGLQGPSFVVDTACSSSMYALDCAYAAIHSNECESAIVAGTNLLLNPQESLQFARLGVLSADGICRPFDSKASGYCRAESTSVIFLQKRRHAKRVYANLLYSKTNCDGFKNEGLHYPSGTVQKKLLKEFYEDLQIPANSVSYIEAHSTGTIVGDPEECTAIDEAFTKGRNTPLLVGSVKSNMGHAEASSGLCSVAKVLIALENQKIPPNINFQEVRPGIPSLVEGRLKVVAEPTDLEGPLICVNSFGFGGANAHALFSSNPKVKVNHGIPKDSMPRLVVWSGRSEEAIGAIMDSVTKNPLDAEYIALLQSSQVESASANIYRGYGVFVQNQESENAICVSQDALHFSGIKRPIVWVYSGMGSQWVGMGRDLMKIPIFADSIEKSHKILLRKKLDLKKIITSEDATTFDNILHSFVGIAAIQIGLTDILKTLGLEPDHIIGHSVGELGCAYADGCFTAEEMILSAYSRGMASLETKVVRGSMAAVGVGYQELKEMLPKGVEIACHNSNQSSTISGPSENISKFVKELTEKGIFAKEVPCSNIPYHSSFIAEMGPKLLAKLSEVVKTPKKRSSKWISSSYPQSRWEEPESQLSSPHYHTNNLLSPVLFEETSALLPEDSLMIEIAPHGLLQAIIKKSFPEAVHIPLTQRTHKHNSQFFFAAIGKIFANGVNMDVALVHPKVEFPVSRGTQMISPNIKWDHSDEQFVVSYDLANRQDSAERRVLVDISRSPYDFVEGHFIDGRCLFPATGYLYLVWETLAMIKAKQMSSMIIEFEDVKFMRATTISKESTVLFSVVIQPGSGKFEISEGTSSLVSGIVREAERSSFTNIKPEENNDEATLLSRDFYKELRLRGYHYNGLFRSVVQARSDGLYGKIKWQDNWIAFLDCMMQIQILARDTRSLILPTSIWRMVIDPNVQHDMVNSFEEGVEKDFEIRVSRELKTVRCGGTEITNLNANIVNRRKPPGFPVLEYYKFIPYHGGPVFDLANAMRMIVQLALENKLMPKVKAVEIDNYVRKSVLSAIGLSVGDLPLVTSELTFLSSTKTDEENDYTVEDLSLSSQTNCVLIIASECINKIDLLEEAARSFGEQGFFICRENVGVSRGDLPLPKEYKVITSIQTEDESFVVLQFLKTPKVEITQSFKISEKDESFAWVDALKVAIKSGPTVIVAEKESNSGIIGLVNCLRLEPDSTQVACIFIDDLNAPKFSLDNPFYQNQLKLGLAINVLRNGQWGSYRHLQILQDSTELPARNHCFVNTLVKSDLSSLKWINGPFNFMQPKGELIKIQYSALNFKDVMIATGRLSAEIFVDSRLEQEGILGFEYSGVTSSGKRVMGINNGSALSSHVFGDNIEENIFILNCPDGWTLEEAATVPCVYGTVYAAFFLHANIQKGKSILIHAGTGGIGLAAIRIAFAYGLEVFTTVSTEEKKKYLLDEFPKLKEQNIGNSRDTSFEKMINHQTNGKGVDYVLNSLSEEKLLASIRCLAEGGMFLEIGKFDIANDSKIGLGCFMRELSFHVIMLDKILSGKSSNDNSKVLMDYMRRDIKKGFIKPLKANVFEANQVEQAFRFLASGKHMGKVLIKVRESEFAAATLPISVVPRIYCSPDLSYIIPGGLGGFGLELADWLVLRGCKNLVLSSSRGITKQYQAYRIKIWESYGVKVNVNTSDISTKSGCEKLIRDSMKLGPVGGIFNLAVVLKDSIFENQDAEKFVDSMGPKAVATKHLDELSRVLCPDLQYFVVFSSVSCGRGNAGQSNYGMANSVMERIMEQRHNLGLPAKAIQWGAVGEVGLVADMLEDKLDMEIGGTLQQRISSCLEELDPLMTIAEPIVSSMVVAEKRFKLGGKESIVEVVMNIMGIRNLKSVSLETSLTELGMDSLMAVELKQIFEREFDIPLSVQELRALNFKKIIQFSKAKDAKEMIEILKVESTGFDSTMLIKHIGDEATSDETILHIKSAKQSETMSLLIPGIEGIVFEPWYILAAGLNFSTSVLQLKKTSMCENLDDIIALIEKDVLDYFKDSKSFHLVAHSFGCFIALKLGELLEKKGKSGRITFIDGAPLLMKAICNEIYRDQAESSIQNSVLMNILSLVSTTIDERLLRECLIQPSWEEKVKKAVSNKETLKIYSKEFLTMMLNAILNRTKIILKSDPKIAFINESKGFLIRPTQAAINNVSENYDLDVCFKDKIDVKFLEGDHVSILKNSDLAVVLNDIHSLIE